PLAPVVSIVRLMGLSVELTSPKTTIPCRRLNDFAEVFASQPEKSTVRHRGLCRLFRQAGSNPGNYLPKEADKISNSDALGSARLHASCRIDGLYCESARPGKALRAAKFTACGLSGSRLQMSPARRPIPGKGHYPIAPVQCN